MSAFAIVPAALTGFRLTRAQPRAVLLWAAAILAISVVDAAVVIATGAQGAYNRLQAMQLSGAADPAAILSAVPRLAPALAISFLLSLGLGAVLLASVFRAELRPERRVTLGLGHDERRMALVLALLFAAQFVVGLPVLALVGLVALVAGGGAAGVAAVCQAVGTALGAVVMVRLALAPPIAVAEHGLGLAKSLRLTRGRFWPLLGSLCLAAALAAVVFVLADVVFGSLAGLVLTASGHATAAASFFVAKGEGWAALVEPGVLAGRAFSALTFALVLPILAGPVAAAYLAFEGEALTPASDVRRPAPPPGP